MGHYSAGILNQPQSGQLASDCEILHDLPYKILRLDKILA